MSTINKEPFIKKLLGDCTSDQLKDLALLIDGKGTRTVLYRTMSNKPVGLRTNFTVADEGVHMCNLQLEYSLFDGYLVYTAHFCVLIHFTDAQVLGMFDINVAKNELASVDEALSVVELRGALGDLLIEKGEYVNIQVNDIESGDETAGKVIVSDGNGGAEWGTVDSVSANPTLAGDESELTGLEINNIKYAVGKSLSYLTTAPTSANTSGRLIIVVLSAEPDTKYDGYLYLITEA